MGSARAFKPGVIPPRAAEEQRANPVLAEGRSEFFRRLSLEPVRVVARSELLALSLSADFRFECGICERNYMLRSGCPCSRD